MTEVDGIAVNTTGRLRNLIASRSGKVHLSLLRAGKKVSLDVTLAELPDAEPSISKKVPGTSPELELGLGLADLGVAGGLSSTVVRAGVSPSDCLSCDC